MHACMHNGFVIFMTTFGCVRVCVSTKVSNDLKCANCTNFSSVNLMRVCVYACACMLMCVYSLLKIYGELTLLTCFFLLFLIRCIFDVVSY